MKVIFLHTNVVSLTNIECFNGSIDDKSQTCVSCMLSGAGRTEPQLGRLLLLDSTGTSGASCSALRVATSLSKYACHKTQDYSTGLQPSCKMNRHTHQHITLRPACENQTDVKDVIKTRQMSLRNMWKGTCVLPRAKRWLHQSQTNTVPECVLS